MGSVEAGCGGDSLFCVPFSAQLSEILFEQFQSQHQVRIIEQLLSENHKNQLQIAGLAGQVR